MHSQYSALSRVQHGDRRALVVLLCVGGLLSLIYYTTSANYKLIPFSQTTTPTIPEWVEKEVYSRFGYDIIAFNGQLPEVRKMNTRTCEQEFHEWSLAAQSYDEKRTVAPNAIPDHLRDAYLMFGRTKLTLNYRNDILLNAPPASWTFNETSFDRTEKEYRDRATYGIDGVTILDAMKWLGVEGKNGMVVGSITPWIERYAVHLGARHVTTLEYSKIIVNGTDRISAVHPVQFAKHYDKYIGHFDFVASFSSLEHSGLGRYGDPLDPVGDLREMAKIKCVIKQGGHLLLGLPFGQDELVFNLHRIYGRIRLPMMIEGFRLIAIFDHGSSEPVALNATKHFPVYQWRQYTLVLQRL